MLKTLRGQFALRPFAGPRPAHGGGPLALIATALGVTPRHTARPGLFDSFSRVQTSRVNAAHANRPGSTPLPRTPAGSARPAPYAPSPRLGAPLPSYEQVMATRQWVQKTLGAGAHKERVNDIMRGIFPDPRPAGVRPRDSKPPDVVLPRATDRLPRYGWKPFNGASVGTGDASLMARQAATFAMLSRRKTTP
jgi:hypothetical protein